MTLEDLEHKEHVLRENFKAELDRLNVDGMNDMCTIKSIKLIGILWHLTHQLRLAEEKEAQANELKIITKKES